MPDNRWEGEEAEMFEHTLGIVRNLCHGSPGGAKALLEAVEQGEGVGKGGKRMLEVLGSCMGDAVPTNIAEAAIATVSNMAVNCPELRLAVGMDGRLVALLKGALTSGGRGGKVMTQIGWCLVNLIGTRICSASTRSTTAIPNSKVIPLWPGVQVLPQVLPQVLRTGQVRRSREGHESTTNDLTTTTHDDTEIYVPGREMGGDHIHQREARDEHARQNAAWAEGKEGAGAAEGDKGQGDNIQNIEEHIAGAILAHFNAVDISEGVRKLVGVPHLDSDLRRR